MADDEEPQLSRYVDRVLHERVVERIRRRRGELGWSARQLGDASGVPRSVIANFENLRTTLNVEAYFALVTALRVQPDALMREVACLTCYGLPPEGFSCSSCGARNDHDLCIACHGRPPSGFQCKACGASTPETLGPWVAADGTP